MVVLAGKNVVLLVLLGQNGGFTTKNDGLKVFPVNVGMSIEGDVNTRLIQMLCLERNVFSGKHL